MVEVIGFIISLLALLYIFMRQSMPAQRRSQPSIEQAEEGMDDPFKDYLKAIEKEAVAREVAQQRPPPPPKRKKEQKRVPIPSLEERRLASDIESRRLRSSLEERHLKSRIEQQRELSERMLAMEEEPQLAPSRAQLAIQRLVNRQDMIIYQEIMDKPKSLRS